MFKAPFRCQSIDQSNRKFETYLKKNLVHIFHIFLQLMHEIKVTTSLSDKKKLRWSNFKVSSLISSSVLLHHHCRGAFFFLTWCFLRQMEHHLKKDVFKKYGSYPLFDQIMMGLFLPPTKKGCRRRISPKGLTGALGDTDITGRFGTSKYSCRRISPLQWTPTRLYLM